LFPASGEIQEKKPKVIFGYPLFVAGSTANCIRLNKDMPAKSPSHTAKNAADPLGFFQMAGETFEEAERNAGGSVDFFCEIAGYNIRLRFAGPALVPFIVPALEHLTVTPSAAPALTICLWDSISTRTKMPPPPWTQSDYTPRCGIDRYTDDRVCTAFSLVTDVLSLLDRQRNLAMYWIRDARQIPYFESGTPLLTILHWWMGNQQRQLIHAGAVGHADGGVLLVGKGGSGKSSTSLLCLAAPLLYAGDDYCLVTTKPAPYVHSIFSSGKVDARDTGRFPSLAPALSNAHRLNGEKALYFLHPHFPGKISTGFPLRAIVLPQITGHRETTFRKISASASLLALAPSTIFQLPGAGLEAFKSLGELVKQLPSFALELGTDRSEIPNTISRLITSLNK
jgi:hypothetical protein